MAVQNGIRIEGLEALRDMLEVQLPREAHNVLRTSVYATARWLRDEIKAVTPVKTGNLRKSVKARRGRGTRTDVYSDVIFEQGMNAKADGFYWRFVEHGHRSKHLGYVPARPFVYPTVARLEGQIPRKLTELTQVALEKAIARKAKRLARVGT